MDSTIFAISILFYFVSINPQHQIMAKEATKGFTLDLIHRDSIHSPLYPGNLTETERIKRLVKISKARIFSFESKIMRPQDVNIRPIITHDNFFYMVRVGIGSRSSTLHLSMDTDSSLIWTQCYPCNPCFPQDDPMFIPAESRTYQLIPCNHTLCKPPQYTCINGQCVYNQEYMDHSFTRGTFATDQLTFASRMTGRQERIQGIVFGCSHQSSTNMFRTRKVSGIIGMDLQSESLIMQLASHIAGPVRFSYCFVPKENNGGISYLRFGTDIIMRRNPQSTPIFRINNLYYVTLEDVSVDGHRLRLPRGTFALHPDGTGGCTLDTGSMIGFLIRPAYDSVKQAFMDYFRPFNLRIVSGSDVRLDLCYNLRSGFTAFPSMDLHFQGANLHIEAANMFQVMPESSRFCLLLLPDDETTMIGAAQQQNVQFVYDVTGQRIYFAPQNCNGT